MMQNNKNVVQDGKKFDKKTFKRLISYITQHHAFMFTLVIIAIIVSSLAGVVGSLFTRVLIDDYITPLTLSANPVFTGLLKAILFMVGVYALGIVANYIMNYLMVIIEQNVLKQIRDEMFSHMQKLPIKYFDTHSHGDIMSRYTNDTDTLMQLLARSLPTMISSIIIIVSVFCAMIATSIHLTVLIVVCLTGMMYITKNIARKSGKYFALQQKSIGTTNGYIEEMINGQKVIKVFCHEEQTKQKFDELNEELCKNATQANRFANMLMPIMGNFGNMIYVFVAIMGGVLAVNSIGGLTLGAIASFLQLTKSFMMPINQVSQQLNSVVMALAGAERIFNLLDEEVEIDDGNVTLVKAKYKDDEICETQEDTGMWAWKCPNYDGSFTYVELKGDVRFFDVDFGYDEDKLILKNISLFAKPGQKIAFVGATGAGKTTITNLINRFYDIADGKIRYDGININKIRKSDLRRSLGIVLQDTHLFTGTVMENIRYGKLDATDEEIYSAAKRANANGFISMLPEGYNTVLTGDGSGLSQGQKQLISIARAAVANPPVMILDEATSSIDTRTEIIVQKGMDALMHGRTVFVIAHRLSTVQNSDAIIVLDFGKIIERGDHDELIEKQGKYYELYTGKNVENM